MLLFNNKTFSKISITDLKSEDILERYGLQETIENSWDVFKNEVNLPDCYLIGSEVQPHPSVKNRIDILAFDPNTCTPIVIELKRGKDKNQLLQAITYGSMVATWDAQKFINEAKSKKSPDLEDIESTMGDLEIEPSTKLILIAETFDPEVMISSDWLYDNYGVDVTAISVELFSNGKETYFHFSQKYPLPELKDTYVARSAKTKQSSSSNNTDITWDDVAEKISYPWGRKLINLCRAIKDGEPHRRRFGIMRSHHDGFDWISINIRQKYANVYMRGKPENANELLSSKFSEKIDIGTWRDGYSIIIDSESKMNDLIKWLELDSAHLSKSA